VLAVSIFAAAILISVNARRALLVILFVGSLAVSAAAVQAVLWPGQVSCERPWKSCTGSSRLDRRSIFCFDSRKVANWAHIFGPLSDGVAPRLGPLAGHPAPGADLFIDLIFGLSMLMVVLDQYRDRTFAAGGRDSAHFIHCESSASGTMLLSTLDELVRLMNAKGGWFRLLENGSLRLVQHVGVSDAFAQSSQVTTLDEATEKILHTGGRWRRE